MSGASLFPRRNMTSYNAKKGSKNSPFFNASDVVKYIIGTNKKIVIGNVNKIRFLYL